MISAVEQVRSQYDAVPYASHPFPQTAPEHLAAVAHLFGLKTPCVATSRVLELGCSSGGNLIPLAVRHPGARVLGLDLSGVQIQQGQARVAAMGLDNLELRQADLGEVDSDALGEFDFILCHGVYSWVPQHVQDAILRICKQNLAPEGVAYVSYNTYPGWKAKEIVRDAMMLRGNPRDLPAERLSFARGMIDFLQQVARKDSVLAKALEENAPSLRSSRDYYLLHEYLEAFNAPCYFQQLLERAEVHGLSYLAEAELSGMFVKNYGDDIAGPLLKECGHSQVLLEQYLDFVVNRTFRQTLLVHASRSEQIRYQVQPERYQAFHFAAWLPCLQGSTRQDGSMQEYGVPGKATVNTPQSAVKLAMDRLTADWPCTLAYADLLACVRSGLHPDLPEAQSQALLDDLLEHLVIRGLVKYHLAPIALADLSARPAVDPQVRNMARLSQQDADASTFNQWHETVPLSVVERWLLPELDGTRDRQALADLLLMHAAQGRIAFLQQGQPVAGEAQLAACALEQVDLMLARLPQLKLLRQGPPRMATAGKSA